MKKLLIPLLVWEALVLGGMMLYMLTRHGAIDDEDMQGLVAIGILGLSVVLICWPICRTMTRISGMMAGFFVGIATSIAGGCIWSLLATEKSFALPYQFIFLGLLLSIPSGIGGAAVGFLQSKHPLIEHQAPKS
jgi:Na+/proline symporter